MTNRASSAVDNESVESELEQSHDITRHHAADRDSYATIRRTRLASEFGHALCARGIHDALAYLNARTRFRFTGVYRCEPPVLRNLCLFDRENPALDMSGAVSRLDETYCAIPWFTAAAFSTADSQRDARLRSHAARDSVLCYSGVPVRVESGRAWGTLCHYDLRPRLLPASEMSFLTVIAPILSDWLRERGACD